MAGANFKSFLNKYREKTGSNSIAESRYGEPKYWISTGSMALNRILSGSIKKGIPSGRITLKNALYYSLILFIIATIIGFIISFENGVTVIICSILMILYAYDFKQRCLIGNICVALLTGLTFVYGALITGDIYLGIFLGFLCYILLLGWFVSAFPKMENLKRKRKKK